MELIRHLFSVLSRMEVRYLCMFLETYAQRGKKKELDFIEHLRQNPQISDREMGEYLYQNPRSKAYRHLKKRLYKHMRESMVLNTSLDGPSTIKLEPEIQASLEVYTLLMHAQVLRSRGLVNEAQELLSQALKLAQKHQLSGLRMMVATHLIAYGDDREAYLEQYRHEFAGAIEEVIVDTNCHIQDRSFSFVSSLTGETKEKKAQLLESMLAELKAQKPSSLSVHGQFFSYILELQLAIRFDQNYGLAQHIIGAISSLFESHSSFATPARQASVEILQAHLHLANMALDRAIRSALKVQLLVEPTNRDYLISGIYLMYAYIYADRWQDAMALGKRIRQAAPGFAADSSMKLLSFFELCFAFQQGKYREAYRLLPAQDSLLQDKEGWNVGVRVMEMLILVELGYEELIPNKLENLRKHIRKYPVNPRIRTCYKVFLRLDRNAYHFAQTYREMELTLHQMNELFPWNPISYEVIRWDRWLLTKGETNSQRVGKWYDPKRFRSSSSR